MAERNNTWTCGRLALSTTRQLPGAPILDDGGTFEPGRCGMPGRSWGSVVVRCPGSTLALVIGWEGAQPPDVAWRERRRRRRRRFHRTGPPGVSVAHGYDNSGDDR